MGIAQHTLMKSKAKYQYRGHWKPSQKPLSQRMMIELPLEPIQTNKITKKPIGLTLPPCRYQEFLHQQLSHQNKDTTDIKSSPSAENFKVPELEENLEEEQFTDFDSFMTHHNTHQASEHIQQEYFSHFQDLDDDQY